MSTIQPKKKSSNKKLLPIVAAVIAAGILLFFTYSVWYTPEGVVERVKVIALTDQGCVVETSDGHAFTIDQCNGAQPGEYFDAIIDQKVKERSLMMNPSS